MTAKAKYGDIVTVHFICTLDDGSTLDSSENKLPLEITIGKSGYLKPFERAFIGMEPGERKTVIVPAEEAYGPYQQELKKIMSIETFPDHIQPEVGMQIKIKKENEEKVIRVIEVTDTSVTLDENHHLAGKDLTFDITLVEIIKPGPSAAAYYALGSTLHEQGFFEEAMVHYRDAVETDPDFVEAHFKLGILNQVGGNHKEAESHYRKVLQLQPDHAEAMVNLGNLLRIRGEYDEALSLLKRAAEVRPAHASTYNTLGAIYKDRDDLDSAIAHYRRALQLDTHFAEALNNLGVALQEKVEFLEAEEVFRKAVQSNPNLAEAHFNLATLLLLTGNFREGWEEYEWRLKLTDPPSLRLVRPWNGEDIDGKSILLIAEQGFGDTIQFIRYASSLAEMGAEVSVAAQKELAGLFEKVKGISRVARFGDPLPETDYQCYLLSLPHLLKSDVDNVPAEVPYIFADPLAAQRRKEMIQDQDGLLAIGIAWSGDPTYRRDRVRSLRTEYLDPLFRVKGTVFYKLQKDMTSSTSFYRGENAPVDLSSAIQDFGDTAACIEHLDLVISVDTAVAHLAGAMGKPIWTLLPYVPDWRWMLDREDSPWYPTMRLFRQPSPGDWDSVIERVAEELKEIT